ncbi:unnamed protein product, partial [Closterium sp. NIES-64]
QLVSNIRRLKDPGKGENSKRVLLSGANLLLLSQNNLVEAAGATSIWPSVTDDRGWITHVMRFAADLIADSPVQMDSRKRTYITEAISFVRGNASELCGPVTEFLTSVLGMLLEPSKETTNWSCCEEIEGVILELAEEPFIGRLLLPMLTDEIQKEFSLVHSGTWTTAKAIAAERCGTLLSLVFNIVSSNMPSWTSANQLNN